MKTSDDRRKVAERLKAGGIARNVREAYVLLLHCVGIRPQLPADKTCQEALSRIADLIDPTCEMEDAGDVPEPVKRNLSTWLCSECGSPIYNDMTPTYCTYCGFRVTGGERR